MKLDAGRRSRRSLNAEDCKHESPSLIFIDPLSCLECKGVANLLLRYVVHNWSLFCCQRDAGFGVYQLDVNIRSELIALECQATERSIGWREGWVVCEPCSELALGSGRNSRAGEARAA